MVRSCAAYNCTNRASKGNKIPFHKFPSDPDLRKQWIIATRRENFKPSEFTALCGQHFKKEDYETHFGQRKLKAGVVPSVFQFRSHLQQKKRIQRKTCTSATANYCNVDEEVTIEGFLSNEVDCKNEVKDENDSSSASYFCEKDVQEHFSSNILEEKITIHVDNDEMIIPNEVNLYKSVTQKDDFIGNSNKQDVLHSATENMTESCITDENSSTENMETLLPPRRRRRIKQMYVGDFSADDMNCPKKAKLMFEIAKKTIITKNNQLRNLRKRLTRLQRRIQTMETLVHLKSIKKVSETAFRRIRYHIMDQDPLANH